MIKDKGKGSSYSKSIELYITVEKLTHTPTLTYKALSNLSAWSWVGSCVQHRLMKASHLKDRSENEARSECYQRGPNDLWVLKHWHSLPLHRLPLISHRSLQTLGYPASERDHKGASRFVICLFYNKKEKSCTLIHSVPYLPQASWFSPGGDPEVETPRKERCGRV